MGKKKILLVVNAFSIGGTIVSLYSLLSMLDSQKLEVDIFARQRSGDYRDHMPNCNILAENLWLSHSVYNKGVFCRYFSLLLLCARKAFEKVGIDLYKVYNYIGGKQIGTDKYDAVIAYDETLPRFISYLPAKKRISWIHCDYRRHALGNDESKYYNKIDTIVCVAESMRNVFIKIYPQYTSKTLAIHNIINVEDIVKKSKEKVDDPRFQSQSNGKGAPFTLVSCGRLDPVKQFSLIPAIASKIKKATDKAFRWYIIGEGEDRKAIEQAIIEYDMQNNVILLGKKSNPYVYMAKSDVYVCTSYSEAYSLVINEARALQIPVVCNTYESAYESVAEGRDGYIVPIEHMHETLLKLMQHPFSIDRCYIENNENLNKVYSLF